jgi:hypothetical protein
MLIATYRRSVARGGRGMLLACPEDSDVGGRLTRAGLDRAIPIHGSIDAAEIAAREQPRPDSATELLSL